MSMHFANIAQMAAADGSIASEEILEMRRAGWADGKMTRQEAEAIFEALRNSTNPSPEWSDFFVEAIQQHVLEGTEPRGYASEEESAWLIAQVEADGRVCSMTELELLTRIIEKAHNVPESLKAFVLGVLETAVLEGTGPTRCGGQLSDTHVTEAECKLIRRVIFGSASDRPAAVSRREAEMLFRIKDATEHASNSSEFRRLFVQGVGNYLMGFAGAASQISRERQLELDAFIADNRPSVGRFLGEMAVAAPNAFGVVFGKRDSGVAREDLVAADAEVTSAEKSWVDEQIGVNGKIDDYDKALLEFIAEEVGQA